MPGPIIPKPKSATGIPLVDTLMDRVVGDDPLGGFSPIPVVGPVGMALDPLQKEMAKRALEAMSTGTLPASRAADLLRGLGATSQDIGNLIPNLPESIRGGIRSLLRKDRTLGGGKMAGPAWTEQIPFAESTGSAPLQRDLNAGFARGTARRKNWNPSTVADWTQLGRQNPKAVRQFGKDPRQVLDIIDFLDTMGQQTDRYKELMKMGYDEFLPVYDDLVQKTGWKPK